MTLVTFLILCNCDLLLCHKQLIHNSCVLLGNLTQSHALGQTDGNVGLFSEDLLDLEENPRPLHGVGGQF